MNRTSQCLRIAERPPATDLRGGKASEDSFIIWMANLVVEYAVNFRLDLFLDVGPESAVSSEDFVRFLFSLPKTDRNRSGVTLRSVSQKSMVGWVVRDKVVCIPSGSESWGVKGPDVGKVEGPIPRSGVDSVGRSIARSTSMIGSSMSLASLLASLRVR